MPFSAAAVAAAPLLAAISGAVASAATISAAAARCGWRSNPAAPVPVPAIVMEAIDATTTSDRVSAAREIAPRSAFSPSDAGIALPLVVARATSLAGRVPAAAAE